MNARERGGERSVLPGLGRRRFLAGAAATAALAAAGCGGSDGAAAPEGEVADSDVGRSEPRPAPELSGPPFTLGVASGDPTATAVILWTRLAPDPTADDGLGGMPDVEVDVAWEVATDEAFATVVASGIHTAIPRHAHAVHVDATDLEPATDHWYRFAVGDAVSPTGRTRTLAEGSPDRFALAVVNCQMYETGAYGAYRHLLDEPVDLVLHLGDYIYEYPGGSGEGRHSLPDRTLATLADFRLRYASYKLDPDLAKAHARFPFVVTWDDHEVANNYMGDTLPSSAAPDDVRALKAAAYQAWWEHLPVRLDPPEGPDLAVHRDLVVGDLAHLYVLDQRQDADVPPCREETVPGLDYGDCASVETEDRTRLGADQDAWLAGALAASTARWNLLGNPVVLAGVNGGTERDAYYLDTWDGYPQARRRLIDQLRAVDNPVVLTGDYHAGMVLDVRAEPFDPTSELVASEFMAPPISSALFSADVSARTPQLREQIDAHGYLVVAVTAESLTATFRTLADVRDPETDVATAAAWTVRAGDPEPRRA